MKALADQSRPTIVNFLLERSQYGEDLNKPGHGDNIEHALAAMELHWLDKLQPFGGRGYNSAKAFERNMNRLRIQSGIEPAGY